MRKVFIFLALAICHFGFADMLPRIEIWKVFKISDKCIVIDQNLDIWELNSIKPNQQSWMEWFLSRSPTQPNPSFFFNPALWKEKQVLQAYPYYFANSDMYALIRNPSEDLKKCTHLLENLETKDKAFARQITVDQFFQDFKAFYMAIPSEIEYNNICMFISEMQMEELIRSKEGKYSEKHMAFNQKHDFMKKAADALRNDSRNLYIPKEGLLERKK